MWGCDVDPPTSICAGAPHKWVANFIRSCSCCVCTSRVWTRLFNLAFVVLGSWWRYCLILMYNKKSCDKRAPCCLHMGTLGTDDASDLWQHGGWQPQRWRGTCSISMNRSPALQAAKQLNHISTSYDKPCATLHQANAQHRERQQQFHLPSAFSLARRDRNHLQLHSTTVWSTPWACPVLSLATTGRHCICRLLQPSLRCQLGCYSPSKRRQSSPLLCHTRATTAYLLPSQAAA